MLTFDNRYIEYVSMGEFRTDREWIHPERIIDSYEVILVLEGTVYIEEDCKKYILNKNDIIILEPAKMHSGYKISEKNTAFYWVHYRSNMPVPFKVYSGSGFYETKIQLKKLLHISNTLAYPQSSADACMLMILNELGVIGNDNDLSSSLANKIAEYIRINITENHSVSAIAEHFGYHPDYVGKIFKKSFNVGIKEYVSLQNHQGKKHSDFYRFVCKTDIK